MNDVVHVVDKNGKYLGCFSDDLIPEGSREVPAPENAEQIWKNNKWSAPPVFATKTKVYKATIWKRCTDQEYTAIQSVINQTAPRIQAIFADATYLDQNDEMYYMIMAGAVAAVGEERAIELLEPEF